MSDAYYYSGPSPWHLGIWEISLSPWCLLASLWEDFNEIFLIEDWYLLCCWWWWLTAVTQFCRLNCKFIRFIKHNFSVDELNLWDFTLQGIKLNAAQRFPCLSLRKVHVYFHSCAVLSNVCLFVSQKLCRQSLSRLYVEINE